MPSVWDFNENKNYISVGDYKVLDLPDANAASELLYDIDIDILNALLSIKNKEKITPELDILLNTPYALQEMQTPENQGSVVFEGLNKPKGVKMTNDESVGPDGKRRATYRRIFLTLRHPNGKLKKSHELKNLVAHEITHTAMNHVRWRDEDHNNKFNKINKLILKHLVM